jgi:pyrroloquinoline quinone biosynthesis protein B
MRALLVLVSMLGACAAPRATSAARADAPYVVVLGTAQDGGLPQIGCDAACCAAARADPERRRLVTSLLLVDPRSGKRWLFDATPDLPAQVERARPHGHPEGKAGEGRPALFDGVFLTHAHMGHYAGLLALGREAYGSAPQTVRASAAMGAFLRANAPWSLLVDARHVELAELVPGQPVELAPDLTVTPLAVSHRQELSDTLAFVLRGPNRALLYLPDIDAWERMDPPIEARLAAVDVALVDATFFDGGELPGRDLAAIPHPFVVHSLARFAPLPAEERAKVRFTHLNHSNPAADPASAAAARVRAAGMAVAREGEVHGL